MKKPSWLARKVLILTIALATFGCSAKSSCENNENFIVSMSRTLEKNRFYELLEDGVELEQGEVKGSILHRRLLAISTSIDGVSRATFFLGKESDGDESSYVYSMVNDSNKIFNSVSRNGIRVDRACSVKFEVSMEGHSMTIEVNSNSNEPFLSFVLEDGSYIKYKFHDNKQE